MLQLFSFSSSLCKGQASEKPASGFSDAWKPVFFFLICVFPKNCFVGKQAVIFVLWSSGGFLEKNWVWSEDAIEAVCELCKCGRDWRLSHGTVSATTWEEIIRVRSDFCRSWSSKTGDDFNFELDFSKIFSLFFFHWFFVFCFLFLGWILFSWCFSPLVSMEFLFVLKGFFFFTFIFYFHFLSLIF